MNFIDTLTDKKLTLDGVDYPLLHLGDFFKLELLRKELKDNLRTQNRKGFQESLENILFLQTHGLFKFQSFYEKLQAGYLIIINNHINADAAIFRPRKESSRKEEIKKSGWDYDGRTLAIWINTFAEAYHWTLSDILNLPLNTAIYLYQEIALNNQYKKEWEYSLTELAYPYNKSTEKSEFKPLVRPEWMQEVQDTLIPVTRIPIDMLPYGVVTDYSGMGKLSQNEQSFSLSKEQTKEG